MLLKDLPQHWGVRSANSCLGYQTPGTYIDYGVEHKDKDPKLKVGDNIKWEYQTTKIFCLRKLVWRSLWDQKNKKY